MKVVVTDNGSSLADAGVPTAAAGRQRRRRRRRPRRPRERRRSSRCSTGAAVADPGLAFLYPYDKTVWPRGILAPLVQWTPGAQADYDAVYIKLTEASFSYHGFFAKTATPFIHHPIPQQAWKQLLASNAGEDVTVSLTFAKGGVAYGPITRTWKIASAPLKGIVYYNSYGTRLAKNYTGAIGGDGQFGAATLAIKGGSTDPALVAGATGGQIAVPRLPLGRRERFGAHHAARPRRPAQVQRLRPQDATPRR